MPEPTTIEVRGWKAIPNPTGGYDLHKPGAYETFSGWCGTEELAREWLDTASGAAYDRLPAVKRSELREEVGQKNPIAQFPFRRNEYYQHTFYYYGDKCLGSIQYKFQRGRGSYLTSPYGTNSCVQGSDLKWLCKENGLRLVG